MSSDPTIWPEPIRDSFDSDEEHLRAWLAWAAQTPGGWQARWAERHRGAAGGRRIHIEGTDADTDAVESLSGCCRAVVVPDPLVIYEERGLCTSCRAILDRTASGWHPAP